MNDHHCSPDPSLPPSPHAKIGQSRPHAPPRAETISPVLACTTRMPASLAGSAAASQSAHYPGEEARALRRGLVDGPIAGVPVVADGRCRRRRPRVGAPAGSSRWRACASSSTRESRIWPCMPRSTGDRRRRRRPGARRRPRRRAAAGRRCPCSGSQVISSAELAPAGAPAARPRWPSPAQVTRQGAADQPGGPGDRDAHQASSASKSPPSRRYFSAVRKRAASAPSTSRWS